MRGPGLGACLLVLMGALSGISAKDGKNHLCNLPGYKLHEAEFDKKPYWLCLQLVNIGTTSLVSAKSAIILDPETGDSEALKPGHPLDATMAFGYPLGHTGSAEGYIGDDHKFYGVLHINNRTIHADPHGLDNPKRTYGAFEGGPLPTPTATVATVKAEASEETETDKEYIEATITDEEDTQDTETTITDEEYAEDTETTITDEEDIETETEAPVRRRRQYTQFAQDSPFGINFPYSIEEIKRIPGIARARVCELLLLADMKFYQNDANSSLNQVVRRMVHAVAQADIIFRNSDFNEDGVPDNIGFTVKYIVVLTSNETNTRVFGDLLNNREVDGKQYLMRFARVRRLSEVCLGVAFSGHAFFNRTLGLSFTSLGGGIGGAAGGLCDRRAYGRTFNTLALAHATTDDKDRVPERIAALTLAHEMGHSFGAHHDDNFPNPECQGYLMGSQSSSADNINHYAFSLCSKRLIASTLQSMSYCLVEEESPYCGNGIVEQGETCDCGMPASCNHRDPCCTPRAGGALVYDDEGSLHVAGCSVSPAALCHPSQGLCCNSRCEYADLSPYGIDCGTMRQECTCITKECRCGLSGRCLPDGTCHASECALLGLRECQCENKGAGGKVGDARMCGVCCKLESKGTDKTFGEAMCVGAEFAAKVLMDNGFDIPAEWPDDTYRGPNTSVRICSDKDCLNRTIRAWPAGGVCVSRGEIGFCSLTGVCKPSYLTPRSNLFPNVMLKRSCGTVKQKQKPKPKPLNTSTRTTSVKLLLILSVIFFII